MVINREHEKIKEIFSELIDWGMGMDYFASMISRCVIELSVDRPLITVAAIEKAIKSSRLVRRTRRNCVSVRM